MKHSVFDLVPWRVRLRSRRLGQELNHAAGGYLFGRDPLIPPDCLHAVGGPEFVKVGEEFLRHFVEVGGLQPHHRVLDVGFGTGRMAPRCRQVS